MQSFVIWMLFLVAVLFVIQREEKQVTPQASTPWSTNTISITPVNYTFRQFEDALVESVAQNKQSVVSIIATKDFAYYYSNDPFRYGSSEEPKVIQERREVGGWSGIFVHRDGYIVTNRHVIDDADATYTAVFYDGSTAPIEKIRRDPLLDMAVVKIAETTIAEDITPASILWLQQPVQIWQFTYAIGNTLAQFQNSVTLGIISGRNREVAVDERNMYVGLYQTDTPISMGNSGGPLFNIDGQVIGINTAVSAVWQNIGFALPITQEFIDATIASIQEYDQIHRPFIGIRSRFLTKSVAQELQLETDTGMYITELVPDAPAEKAWLHVWDILVAINWLAITDEYPLLYQLYTYKPEQAITVTLIRNNQEREVELKLGMQ